MHHVPPPKHVKSSKLQNSKRSRDDAVLSSAYPVHLGADPQVVTCHHYLHPFVE